MLPFSHPHHRQLPRGFAAYLCIGSPMQVSCCLMLRIPLVCFGCAARGSQITCFCVLRSMHSRNAHIISHWCRCNRHRGICSQCTRRSTSDAWQIFACLLFSADGWSVCALLAARCSSRSTWAPHLLHTYVHTWSPCACLLCVRFIMFFPVAPRPWVPRDRTLGHTTLAGHLSFPVCSLLVYTHCLLCARR